MQAVACSKPFALVRDLQWQPLIFYRL